MYLWLDESSYSRILYEIYYCSHKMAYVDVPIELEDIILDYIKKGMYIVNPARFDSMYEVTKCASEYAQMIKDIDSIQKMDKYSNPLTGEYFMKDNPKLIIPMIWLVFNYYFLSV